MKYSFEIWDRKSFVNRATPEQVLLEFNNTTEQIYLIKDEDNNVCVIQTESIRPYKDIPIEECAQRQVDEMNTMLINSVPAETFEESARLDTYYRNHPEEIHGNKHTLPINMTLED